MLNEHRPGRGTDPHTWVLAAAVCLAILPVQFVDAAAKTGDQDAARPVAVQPSAVQDRLEPRPVTPVPPGAVPAGEMRARLAALVAREAQATDAPTLEQEMRLVDQQREALSRAQEDLARAQEALLRQQEDLARRQQELVEAQRALVERIAEALRRRTSPAGGQ